jgi:hypothetical protein
MQLMKNLLRYGSEAPKLKIKWNGQLCAQTVKKKTQTYPTEKHSFVSSFHLSIMARSRRKRQVVLSDDEAGPPNPQQQQLKVNESHSDVNSDVDVPLPSGKRPRLEDEATVIGKRTSLKCSLLLT